MMSLQPQVGSTNIFSKVLTLKNSALLTSWLPLLKAIQPLDLLLFLTFQFSYQRILQYAYSVQILIWKALSFGTPSEWNQSILGFAQQRCNMLAKFMGLNYIVKLLCLFLFKIGFRIRPDLHILFARIFYIIFLAQSLEAFKANFMQLIFPKMAANQRNSYFATRTTSVIIWGLCGLIACEMVSTFFKVPLSSTLAFGGVGGLALGLSARDIVANFLGGILLLFNEPFTPGDMVAFKAGSMDLVGRVERIGWAQTRIRGRDTRPTYIPNSHFVQSAITNMERITHRQFEATSPLRFQVIAT